MTDGLTLNANKKLNNDSSTSHRHYFLRHRIDHESVEDGEGVPLDVIPSRIDQMRRKDSITRNMVRSVTFGLIVGYSVRTSDLGSEAFSNETPFLRPHITLIRQYGRLQNSFTYRQSQTNRRTRHSPKEMYLRDSDEEYGENMYYDSRPMRERRGSSRPRTPEDSFEFYDDDVDNGEDEDEDFLMEPDLRAPPVPYSKRRPSTWDDDEDFEGVYEDDDDDDDDEPAQGNFWVNPKAALDFEEPKPVKRAPIRRDRRLRNGKSLESTAEPHRRRSRSNDRRRGPTKQSSRKTTFRSGTPPPPPGLSDLYNRLFWYGFDPADSTSPADPTMFGGTKGKFNGLAYLNDGVGVMPRDRQKPRRPRGGTYWEDEEDYDEDDLDDDFNDEEEVIKAERESSSRFQVPVTPPYDPPRPMSSSRRSNPRRRSRGSFYNDDYELSNEGGDWIDTKVSSWFGPDEDDYERDEEETDVGPRRRRRQKRPNVFWAPFEILESLLGVEEMDDRAIEYDRRMGIGRARSSTSRDRYRSSERKYRRKGYAYPYEDDDGTPPVIEFEVVEEKSEDELDGDLGLDDNRVSPTRTPKRELSWEDRALAVERVPPAGIDAWGPGGDVGMDARTKAIYDALEDIGQAKQRVEERQKKVEQASEQVSILRVDSELERKRLRRSRMEVSKIQNRLRKIDRKVDDAARALRLAKTKLQRAQDDLSNLETRHWAVLSFYNADKAEQGVSEALRELEENEPAVRRYMEKPDSVSAETSDSSEQSPFSNDELETDGE